jgi:hypothetical protein
MQEEGLRFSEGFRVFVRMKIGLLGLNRKAGDVILIADLIRSERFVLKIGGACSAAPKK